MDDDAIKRAQEALAKKGVNVDINLMREAIVAAEKPPEHKIPVSQGMVKAGHKFWVNNVKLPAHELLAALYRVMEQQRIDEKKAGK